MYSRRATSFISSSCAIPRLRSRESHWSSSSLNGCFFNTFETRSLDEIVGKAKSGPPKLKVRDLLCEPQNLLFSALVAQVDAISSTTRGNGFNKASRSAVFVKSMTAVRRYGRTRGRTIQWVSAVLKNLVDDETKLHAASRIQIFGCFMKREIRSTSSQVRERENNPSSAKLAKDETTFSTTNSSGSVRA